MQTVTAPTASISHVGHIPLWRPTGGYRSMDHALLAHVRSGGRLAEVSRANPGLIRRDAMRWPGRETVFAGWSTGRLLEVLREMARHFMQGKLPADADGGLMDFETYCRVLSASTGMPEALCRLNAAKIEMALVEMDTVLDGLTRGLPREVFSALTPESACGPLSFYPLAERMSVILPSNSPGVNSLWLPALAMRMPVLLKPGREDPWTPFRLLQAFLAAGGPEGAIGFYPSDHDGTAALIESGGRIILFGDQSVADRYAGREWIEVHGPGRSKIVIGEDAADGWEAYVDVIVESIGRNGGRSCVNASAVHIPRHGAELAVAVAERLDAIQPLPLDDAEARLAGFVRPEVAHWTSAQIGELLEVPGAHWVSRRWELEDLVAECDGITYLRPAVVHCTEAQHPLANREFLFPFASVVDTPPEELVSSIGPSLVVTAITRDAQLLKGLSDSPGIQRLNVGPLPTTRIDWTQPHEGNLFEFLFRRRAAAVAVDW